MKILFSLAATFAAATTMAGTCPNLTGSYLCQDNQKGQYILNFTQANVGGVVVYTVNNQQVIRTNGVAIPVAGQTSDGANSYTGTLAYTCGDNVVNADENVNFTRNSDKALVAVAKVTMTYSLDATGNFMDVAAGSITYVGPYAGNPPQDLANSQTCIRQAKQ